MDNLSEKQKSFLGSVADLQADTEEVVEQNQERYLDIYQDLMTSPENRDPALWTAVLTEVMTEEDAASVSLVTIADIADVPRVDRDPMVIAAIEAAARLQSLTYFAEEIIELAERKYPGVHAAVSGLEPRELSEAGEIGVTRDYLNGVKQRRKNQTS